jgi:hypothetical protein
MTVGELIAKLQEFDQDMMVVVDGYEGGVDELRHVQTASIALGYNVEGWYYGDHEMVTDGYLTPEEKEKYPVVTAVYLPR